MPIGGQQSSAATALKTFRMTSGMRGILGIPDAEDAEDLLKRQPPTRTSLGRGKKDFPPKHAEHLGIPPQGHFPSYKRRHIRINSPAIYRSKGELVMLKMQNHVL